MELWLSFTQLSLSHIFSVVPEEPEIEMDLEMSSSDQQKTITITAVAGNNEEKPRIIFLVSASEENEDWSSRPPIKVTPMQENDCPYCKVEPDCHILPFEKRFYKECEFIEDWQTKFYPTCNLVHEVALDRINSSYEDSVLLSTEGSWRTVWKHTIQNKTVILKLLNERRNFTHESFQYHQADVRVMERLTKSPYTVNSFGFCGQSVFTEYASSDARRYIKHIERTLDRVLVARDLARALADIHWIGSSGLPTVSHNDINVANAVIVGHQVKLNDFNLAIMMRRNKTDGSLCKYPVRFDRSKWASPEDIRNSSYIDPTLSDVYSLGNLLFKVLTTRQPWNSLEASGKPSKEEIVKAKLSGKLPYVPTRYANTTKVGLRGVHSAMKMCFEFKAAMRITAKQLSRVLDRVEALTRLKANSVTDVELLKQLENARNERDGGMPQ